MSAELDIAVSDGVHAAIGLDEMQRICTMVLESEGVERPCYVSISVVSDDEMHSLNYEWRGQDRATDVLSLECERPDDPDLAEGEPCELGDIVLAPRYIDRQAASFGVTAANETRLLLIHGMLHLLGYDHIDEDEAELMEAKEDVLLERLATELQELGLSGHVTLTRHKESEP